MKRFTKKLLEKSKKRTLFPLFLLVSIVALAVAYLVSAYKNLFNSDAAYYLGVVELIYNGKVPYIDFTLAYTPLGFYLMLLPRWIMGNVSSYTGYLIANYLFTFAVSWIMGIVAYRISKKRLYALLSILFYLFYNYQLEGVYFCLEPITNFFGLLGIWLLYGRKYNQKQVVIAGMTAGLAFLTKQYGLVYVGMLGLILLFENKTVVAKIKDTLWLVVGFALPLVLLFLYLIGFNGGSFADIMGSLSGSNYGKQLLGEYVVGIKQLFLFFPYLFLVAFLLFVDRKKGVQPLIILFLTLLATTFQFFFQTFLHYYILLLPSVILLFIYGLMTQQKTVRMLLSIILLYQFVIGSYGIAKNTRNLFFKSRYRTEYAENTHQMKAFIRQQPYKPQSIYCLDIFSFPYYFYLGLEPSALKEYAYSFGYETEKDVRYRVERADILLMNKKSNINPSLLPYIETHFIQKETETSYLFIRK